MKKFFYLILAGLIFLPANASARDLATELAGKILLQVEAQGQAWYVNPVDHLRYYLKDGAAAYRVMRTMGLGISNANLAKLPRAATEVGDKELVKRLRGRIVLQVEEHGEAWYINPANGLRYYLKDGAAAYGLMRELSLGIKNQDLGQIPAAPDDVDADSSFDNIAYVKYQGGQFVVDHFGDTVLPPASMTKLMTALVVVESAPDWNRLITITPEILAYPTLFVGDDATSEVSFQNGDQVRLYDLLIALLVASSNQSARAIIDGTGLTHEQFVARMNQKASELGLTHTTFAETAGLSLETVTTAKEMAKIAAAAFAQTAVQSVYAKADHDITIVDSNGNYRTVAVRDRNYSLQEFQPDAVKTGYLVEAQRTVVLKKGETIAVVMHASSNTQRNSILSSLLAD